jgi:MFS family permease
LNSLYRGLGTYIGKVRLFQPNARLYLAMIVLYGLGFGIYQLLFNFYILSQGYSRSFLGTLVTVNSLVALASALPAGLVGDALGRKRSFLVSGCLSAGAMLGVVLWRAPLGFITMNVLAGLGQSLMGVSGSPFLMENSTERERSYLFSFSFGIQTVASFVGNWLGGNLPTWLGRLVNAEPTSTAAYGAALFCVAIVYLLTLVPVVVLRTQRAAGAGRARAMPWHYVSRHPRLLARLIAPLLITSMGAGLLMPFLNVFYRVAYGQADQTIGTLFALSSLSMGIGLLIAPPIADRLGKIKLVILSQGLSIPFLLLMGFSPWFGLSAAASLVRVALMNMSGPVYQAFVMEQVEAEGRATVASLTNMSWNFGWAFSPPVSGWLQETYGFGPVYLGTCSLYILATGLYYWFFGRRGEGTTDHDQEWVSSEL